MVDGAGSHNSIVISGLAFLFSSVPIKFLIFEIRYEYKVATREHEVNKMTQIKSALRRSSMTLVEDMIGVAALIAMLFVGLTLPGAF